MSDTLITRMAALLRHAEKAATPEESAAYQEKAQALATRHAIDLELARNHKDSQERKPILISSSTRIGERGKRGLATYVALYQAIAHANNVKCDIAQNSTVIYPYGFDTDIEVTDALFQWLLPQMISESDAYIRAGEYKTEKVYREVRTKVEGYWGDSYYETEYRMAPVHGKTARISFQNAFASTIARRLNHARKEAEAAARATEATTLNTTPDSPEDASPALSDSVALVLVQREVAVRDFYKTKSNARGSYRGGQSRSYSDHAHGAGRSAGARASLAPARAIGGHRTQVSA